MKIKDLQKRNDFDEILAIGHHIVDSYIDYNNLAYILADKINCSVSEAKKVSRQLDKYFMKNDL